MATQPVRATSEEAPYTAFGYVYRLSVEKMNDEAGVWLKLVQFWEEGNPVYDTFFLTLDVETTIGCLLLRELRQAQRERTPVFVQYSRSSSGYAYIYKVRFYEPSYWEGYQYPMLVGEYSSLEEK